MSRLLRWLSLPLVFILLPACQTSEYAQARIDDIRAEQSQQYTIQQNLERRVADIEAGAEPAYPGEVAALDVRIDDIEGELRGRDDLVERIKIEDAGAQSALWTNLLIGLASVFGLGGAAKATFGRSRSADAVGQVKLDVGSLGHKTEVLVDELHKKVDEGQAAVNQKLAQVLQVIGAFQNGMNQVPIPPVYHPNQPVVPAPGPSTPAP